MTSLNQISERIAYIMNQPLNVMLKENIKFSIRHWRATLIRRDIYTNGMSDEFLQRVYLDLTKVSKADACNFDLNCTTVLRTVNQIPQPIRVKNDILFKFVGNVDGKPFTYTEYEEVPYTCYNKYTSKIIRYSYINGYIYVFNNTFLKKIAIQTPFADPFEANYLCEGCFNDDSPFPCPADMIQQIIQGIISGEMKMMNPTDEEVTIQQEVKAGTK